ncbi:hypothetical protein SDC9_105376 [bioreactor metagenome]|uniref:Uncharacterized protein n=1 Tax=bioreactor metagenome TaxID=1076179 RepID=A0A645AZ73_9ZZZZ
MFQGSHCQCVDVFRASDIAGIKYVANALLIDATLVMLKSLDASAQPQLPLQCNIDHVGLGDRVASPVRAPGYRRYHVEQQCSLASLGLSPQDNDLAAVEDVTHQPSQTRHVLKVFRGMRWQRPRHLDWRWKRGVGQALLLLGDTTLLVLAGNGRCGAFRLHPNCACNYRGRPVVRGLEVGLVHHPKFASFVYCAEKFPIDRGNMEVPCARHG